MNFSINSLSLGAVVNGTAGSAANGGSWFWLTVFAGLALGVSFLCSVAEAVLLSTTPSYVAYVEQQKRRTGRLLAKLKKNIDRPLSAVLTFNTVAHTGGAAGVGSQAALLFGSRSVGIVSAVLTLLILILSEIIPKTIGSVYWRKLAPITAVGVHFLTLALFPLVILSEQITRLIAGDKKMKSFSREEFGALASIGAQEGFLEAKEYRIVGNLLRFRSYRVEQIMTPRTVVFSLPEDTPVSQVFQRYANIPFSRIPVYKNAPDDAAAFVLKSEIMLSQARGEGEKKLRELSRPLKAIPENSSMFNAFEFLLDNREHIALVVDEYGSMEGIVTLEDIVETLLGLEIVDEADVTVDMRELARARWEKQLRQLNVKEEDGS